MSGSDAIAERLRIHIANSEAVAAPKARGMEKYMTSVLRRAGVFAFIGVSGLRVWSVCARLG